MRRLTIEEQGRDLARRTRSNQGLHQHVQDKAVLAQVARLVAAGARKQVRS
jgi:hypothetical protein